MKNVLEVMREYKNKGTISDCWLKEENGYEYLYGLYGYSSIENPEYIENNKNIMFAKVVEVDEINDHIIRITYSI